MITKKKIAVVVPFYNEERNLIEFVKEWNSSNYKKDLLTFFFFDDGSTDKSANHINDKFRFRYQIIKKDNTGHGHTCNYAYHFILENYQFDFILQIDSDNQCDPKYLEYFLKKIKDYEFIFGKRIRREDGFLRLFATKFIVLLIYLKKGIMLSDPNVPYRLMNCEKLKISLKKHNKKNIKLFNIYLTYLICKNYQIYWFPIVFRDRKYGTSKYNFIASIKLIINLIFRI